MSASLFSHFSLLSSLYVFSNSLTMFTASFRAQSPSFVRQPPQSPLSGGPLRAAPPDKGVYRPETWWTGVQGHGGHSVGYSAGWRKSSSLIYW